MMSPEELLQGIEVRATRGPLPAALAGVHYDSRMIQPGWAFVAIHGALLDGHDFIPQAEEHGASLIISELPPAPSARLAWVQVAVARQALALASANWFQHPARRLRLVGVTGTNGKTTTTFLVEAMLRQAGFTTGLLGTVEYHIAGAVLPSPHTTPESWDLQQLLARMTVDGCQVAALEVSSHALALERVYACPFEVAVFTNLTQDHLDFHLSMENYAAAKRRLFQGEGAPPPRAAVVNGDDPAVAAMLRGYAGQVLRFGFGPGADLRACALEHQPEGTHFHLEGPGGFYADIASPLVGRFNVLNTLAALGVGWSLGLQPRALAAGVARWPRVRGRFERVACGQPFTVLVDYAHTPDALTHVLAAARELTRGRLRLVFGCGGDRDRGKRMLMGRAAQEGADWVLLTSDNPRSEDPQAIIADILAGNPPPEGGTDIDRRRAIATALRSAQPGDTVILAGKGHETHQILGNERLHFDDVEEARAALAALGWKG
ncbi:MAG: UDP-N-acetylmuramoyl-L-alanyl-D-glutamate--2,6-diaminopimelate ligase [Terriglobales bacterium]